MARPIFPFNFSFPLKNACKKRTIYDAYNIGEIINIKIYYLRLVQEKTATSNNATST